MEDKDFNKYFSIIPPSTGDFRKLYQDIEGNHKITTNIARSNLPFLEKLIGSQHKVKLLKENIFADNFFIPYNKHECFIEPFNRKIRNLVEAGIVQWRTQHYIEEAERAVRKTPEGPEVFSFKQLFIVFEIWMILIAICIGSYAGEWIFSYLLKRRKKNKIYDIPAKNAYLTKPERRKTKKIENFAKQSKNAHELSRKSLVYSEEYQKVYRRTKKLEELDLDQIDESIDMEYISVYRTHSSSGQISCHKQKDSKKM